MNELIVAAKNFAIQFEIDPALVCAVIEQESDWNPWAIRYEPAFLEKYVPLLLPQTERETRAFSWGLMQLMGEVAREEGFTGDIASLCDPTIGIPAGIKHLKNRLDLAKGDETHALLLWNGGGNPNYPAEVLARKAKYV